MSVNICLLPNSTQRSTVIVIVTDLELRHRVNIPVSHWKSLEEQGLEFTAVHVPGYCCSYWAVFSPSFTSLKINTD